MKKNGRPRNTITDQLCFYSATIGEIGNAEQHEIRRRPAVRKAVRAQTLLHSRLMAKVSACPGRLNGAICRSHRPPSEGCRLKDREIYKKGGGQNGRVI